MSEVIRLSLNLFLRGVLPFGDLWIMNTGKLKSLRFMDLALWEEKGLASWIIPMPGYSPVFRKCVLFSTSRVKLLGFISRASVFFSRGFVLWSLRVFVKLMVSRIFHIKRMKSQMISTTTSRNLIFNKI